jgi:hypothetical protein
VNRFSGDVRFEEVWKLVDNEALVHADLNLSIAAGATPPPRCPRPTRSRSAAGSTPGECARRPRSKFVAQSLGA